jgi:hypothetical protein
MLSSLLKTVLHKIFHTGAIQNHMTLKDKIADSLNDFLSETDRRKVQFVCINIPKESIQIRIMESEFLMLEKGGFGKRLVLHLSAKPTTKNRVRLQSIMNYLSGFNCVSTHRILTYYKVFEQKNLNILDETFEIINVLFPGLDYKLVDVSVMRIENWTTLH